MHTNKQSEEQLNTYRDEYKIVSAYYTEIIKLRFLVVSIFLGASAVLLSRQSGRGVSSAIMVPLGRIGRG